MLNTYRASTGRSFIFLPLLIALALTGCGGSSSPEGVIEQLYTAIETKQLDKAASYFSTKHLGQTNHAQQLQSHLRNVLAQTQAQMEEKGGLDGITILQSKVDEPVARVEAEIKLKSGNAYRVNYSMTLEDNSWKVVLHDNNLGNLTLR
ncbi:DUF4878 domain-containing protein [Ectopseudomonas mendocina]|jgi:hypothetical protein|uniref:DUF4878 domain-containing protein n=1 Tax=Ectopseudomonas mendocina TaxID=300 RepID=UPI0023EB0111|nr:DUF4878 domain-containing protein [Pseudomonas mendocina]